MRKLLQNRILITISLIAVFVLGVLSGVIIDRKLINKPSEADKTKGDMVEDSRLVTDALNAMGDRLQADFVMLFPTNTATPTPTPTPTPSPSPTPTPAYMSALPPLVEADIESNLELLESDSYAQDVSMDIVEEILGIDSWIWEDFITPELCASGFMSTTHYDISVGALNRTNNTVVATVTVSRRDYRVAFAATVRQWLSECGFTTSAETNIWGSIDPGLGGLYTVINYMTNNVTADTFSEVYSANAQNAPVLEETFDIVYTVTLNPDNTVASITHTDDAFEQIRAFLWN